MLKRIIATFLVATALMFSGCGDEAGEDRLAAQNAIDKGDAQVAIDLLASKLDNGTATSDEIALLADAYASRAGFTVTDVTIAFMAASDGASTDDLANLATSLLDQASDTAIEDLDLAIDTYLAIDPRTDDQNFKLGLTYTVKLALLIETADETNPDDLANVTEAAVEGFDIIAAILPPEMETSVADVKSEIDANSDGIISPDEMSAYLATN